MLQSARKINYRHSCWQKGWKTCNPMESQGFLWIILLQRIFKAVNDLRIKPLLIINYYLLPNVYLCNTCHALEDSVILMWCGINSPSIYGHGFQRYVGIWAAILGFLLWDTCKTFLSVAAQHFLGISKKCSHSNLFLLSFWQLSSQWAGLSLRTLTWDETEEKYWYQPGTAGWSGVQNWHELSALLFTAG